MDRILQAKGNETKKYDQNLRHYQNEKEENGCSYNSGTL